MPRIGYKPTEEHKNKIKQANLGKKRTEITKEKIRLSCIGRLIGRPSPRGMLGKKLSEEAKRKIGLANKGRKHTEEERIKISEANKQRYTKYPELKKRLSERFKGEKSYLWNGGVSLNLYSVDWTRSLRISIRERDKYTCQICGEKQGDKAFCVHHIDYDKKNCNSDNLITLCNNCHLKTNFGRRYWIKYFKGRQ